MKKFRGFVMLMAIAAASFTFTSCDDDPWNEPRHWDDPYGWYDDYNHGGWGWNDNDYNHGGQGGQGGQGSQDNQLLQEAQTLVGDWYGKVKYSYIQEDGVSRATDEFYADMTFYQTGNKLNTLSGNGLETDYIYDADGNVSDSQQLTFSWYVDDNGDIYVKYDKSGATFVMDAGASQYGFNLGYYDNNKYKIFQGYMIGTGSVKGDIMLIDLAEVAPTSARTRSGKGLAASENGKGLFGKGATCQSLPATGFKLNGRR